MVYTDADARAARRDFPALARRQDEFELAFLDGPGGTQVPQCTIDAVARVYRDCNVNVGGAFATSHESAAVVQDARAAIADFVGAASPNQVSFGQNMTTLNFALARALGRRLVAGDEVVITALDHEANRGPWIGLAERGVAVREAHLADDGTLDLDHLATLVGPRTRVIAVGIASNALGSVTPFARVRELAHAVGALTVVDAVHYAAHLPLDFEQLGCDFMLCSAYKFYAPHVGILCSRPGLLEVLEPDRLRTQKQCAPWRIETGTLNFAALAGVTATIDYLAGLAGATPAGGAGASRRARLVEAMSAIADYEHALGARYWDALQHLPGVRRHGPRFGDEPRAPTVSFSTTRHIAPIAEFLATQGLQVWHGHFYAPRVVESLCLMEQGGLLRVGFALYNTGEEVQRLLTALEAACARKL
jgi:cysteine desulfurase family protein (TIGR01976 family)